MSRSSYLLKVSRHVVPDVRGGWSVRKSRTPSATRYFPTEHEAAESAARVAKRDGTPVYFHDPGGRVLHKESYRPDLAAPHQKA